MTRGARKALRELEGAVVGLICTSGARELGRHVRAGRTVEAGRAVERLEAESTTVLSFLALEGILTGGNGLARVGQ